ncbi:MAG: hypothetical protein JRJ77_06910 [Deltaproteobacteria bacterium]|nr:hypothetical protein [Deltaproteobacteria bacterium]MBW2340461.1 hypothetical protein [Deltaproteobacteria bacterium]
MNPSNCAKMCQFRTKSRSYFSIVRISPSPLVMKERAIALLYIDQTAEKQSAAVFMSVPEKA